MEKNSLVQHHRKKDFEDYLDDLFDMAHQKALHIKTIREDKQFLLVQWDKRTCNMYNIPYVIHITNKRFNDQCGHSPG